MDAKTAKAILVGLVGEGEADGLEGVRAETLRYGVGEAVVIANEVGRPITLDGTFAADQLEAIVMWMRDPRGVAEA